MQMNELSDSKTRHSHGITMSTLLTITGVKGGLILRDKRSPQLMCLKKACFFTSSASFSEDPSLRSGCFRSNLLMMATASRDKNLGYLTSSLTILSKTSSSSSPGKGDCQKKRQKSVNKRLVNHEKKY